MQSGCKLFPQTAREGRYRLCPNHTVRHVVIGIPWPTHQVHGPSLRGPQRHRAHQHLCENRRGNRLLDEFAGKTEVTSTSGEAPGRICISIHASTEARWAMSKAKGAVRRTSARPGPQMCIPDSRRAIETVAQPKRWIAELRPSEQTRLLSNAQDPLTASPARPARVP